MIDFDKDGWMDLAFTHAGAPGLSLWRNLEGKRVEPVTLPDLKMMSGWGLAPIDYDNDGWVDLVAAGGGNSRRCGPRRAAQPRRAGSRTPAARPGPGRWR